MPSLKAEALDLGVMGSYMPSQPNHPSRSHVYSGEHGGVNTESVTNLSRSRAPIPLPWGDEHWRGSGRLPKTEQVSERLSPTSPNRGAEDHQDQPEKGTLERKAAQEKPSKHSLASRVPSTSPGAVDQRGVRHQPWRRNMC